MPAQKKFDYDGKDFYTAIGNLAEKDYNDAEIAQFIGDEVRSIVEKRNNKLIDNTPDGSDIPPLEDVDAIPDSLAPEVFSRMKNGIYGGWNEQENKLRSMLICQVLQRARYRLNLVYKGVYDKLALGKIKTKTTTTTTRKTLDREGQPFEEVTTTESVSELPPNLQAITVWRWHHDPDFKKAMTQMKRMDVSVEDKGIDKISVNVVYNKKEDLDLQENNRE